MKSRKIPPFMEFQTINKRIYTIRIDFDNLITKMKSLLQRKMLIKTIQNRIIQLFKC